MKKLLLFLVLAVTFNLSAQISTTYFAKPLELNSVPASITKSDSVLVRGTDKIIKYVPRSEFGGSGTQTLQEVLDAGSSASANIFAINSSNGRIAIGDGPEVSNAGFGALNINSNGLVLDNRGNSYPINLLGRNSGVYVQGSNGSSLTLQTGPVELKSTAGIDINNQSNVPTNIKNWGDKVNIDGWAGIDLKSQNGAINLDANQGISLTTQYGFNLNSNTDNNFTINGGKFNVNALGFNFVSRGAPNQFSVSDNSGKISLQSQAGGIELNSSMGPVVIKNGSGAGISIGDASVASPLTIATGSNLGLEGSNLILTANNLFYAGNNAGGNHFALQNDGTVWLKAKNDQFFRIDANLLNVQTSRTDFAGPIQLPTTTVANLPTSPIGYQYATVSDAASPVYLQPVTGGGATVCPVFYNGTSWVAH